MMTVVMMLVLLSLMILLMMIRIMCVEQAARYHRCRRVHVLVHVTNVERPGNNLSIVPQQPKPHCVNDRTQIVKERSSLRHCRIMIVQTVDHDEEKIHS